MLGAPNLDVALQVGSHKSEVEGENHLPAGHAAFENIIVDIVKSPSRAKIQKRTQGQKGKKEFRLV